MEQKLDPEFKKRWVEALRSGEFKQGIEHLYNRSTDSYCCLGVACRISGYLDKMPVHDQGEWIAWSASLVPEVIRGNDSNEVVAALVEMNDKGSRFSEIADYIESNL